MRKLADDLGVWPRTVYHHAGGDRDAIVDLVVEAVLATVERPPPDLPWDAQVRAIAQSLRTALHDHPGTAERLLSHGAPMVPEVLWLPDLVQGILLDAGLPLRDVAPAWHLISSYVSQHVVIEQRWTSESTGRGQMSPADWAEYIEGVRAAAETLPTLSKTLGLADEAGYDDIFSFGLDVILDGLANRIPSSADRSI